jgi:hypothetical protein
MMRCIRVIAGTALLALLIAATGCDSESLYVSVEKLDFGKAEKQLAFDLYNNNPDREKIKVELEKSDDWFSINPTSVTSEAPTEEGPDKIEYDTTTVEVTLDRTALSGDAVQGSIEITGRRLKKKKVSVFAQPPYEAISLSSPTLNIGGEENYLDITLTNINKKVGRLEVFATPDSSWIDISRTAITLEGYNAAATLVIGAKRSTLTGGYHEGQILFEAAGFVPQVLHVFVFQPYQAIVTSNQSLDFGLNERPMLLEVWNGNAEFESLTISANPSANWIEVLPVEVSSAAPTTTIDPVLAQPVTSYDKRQVLVSIKRNRLEEGSHEGYIVFQADSPLVAPRPVVVKALQDADGPDTSGELRIDAPKTLYATPYLIDFAFGLTDLEGNGFVAEPAQLTAGAFENGENVSALVQPVLHRGAVRQLRAEMVLDYSIGMRLHPEAMDNMEYAATELFLAGLPAEGLVGATLYYRDDLDPVRVSPFTLDHSYVADQINNIRSTRIGSFSSGSRMLDTLRQAALRFDQDNVNDEERFILLLAGSGDTSSTETVDRVVNVATKRHVKIHTVGFLSDLDGATMMLDLAVRTGGVYLPVGAAEELPRIISLIVDRLEANYLLRWATLKRQDTEITPGFTIAFSSFPAAYTASETFNPLNLAGNVLEGRLRLTSSRTGDNAAALLRAEYIPRNINRIRIRVAPTMPIEVTPVPAAASGLIEHWTLERIVESDGTLTFDMFSPEGEPLPFATFGGLVRFDFAGVPPSGTPLFTNFVIENNLEEYDAGQFFSMVE